MFVGNSPEELELAGEESGSWLDTVKAAVAPVTSFVSTPGGKVAAKMLFPEAAAAYEVASAAQRGVQQSSKGNKGAPPPSAAPRQAPTSGDVTPSNTSSAGWGRYKIGTGRGTNFFMGADPPMSERQLMAYINREPDPRKRQRMIINHERSKLR
jgi:hypothetical protein